jgi:transcriptional regulator with XRE-family HTH domain
MNEDELQQRVIANIKSIRKSKGLSQEKLADKANISRQLMNDIEGKRRWLSKATLIKLCNALEIDAFELFIPNSSESSEMNETYNIITEKVISEIRKAINETLDKI